MHDTLISRMQRVPMPDAAWRRAEEVQRLLVAEGRHRGVSVPDLMVAATAEHHGLAVLHLDRDFDSSWEMRWACVFLLRSLAVPEPDPGHFDLSNRGV